MQYSGMGPLPLDWNQIESWSRLQGLDIQPKEATALRELSLSYVEQHNRAKEKDCPQPWIDPEELRKQEVSEKVTSQFDALIKRRKGKRGRSSKPDN
jgi:hypothetical protein